MNLVLKTVAAIALTMLYACSPGPTSSRTAGLDPEVTPSPTDAPGTKGDPADFNQDGKVDGADLSLYRDNYKFYPQGCAEGDDCDNDIDGNDFLVIQRSTDVVTFQEGDLDTDGDIDLEDLKAFQKNPALITIGRYTRIDPETNQTVLHTLKITNRIVMTGKKAGTVAPANAKVGDFNLDGSIDIEDINIFKQRYERFEMGCILKDYNCDGRVGSADLAAWQRGFGKTQYRVGDLDKDGDVDQNDFNRYVANPSLID